MSDSHPARRTIRRAAASCGALLGMTIALALTSGRAADASVYEALPARSKVVPLAIITDDRDRVRNALGLILGPKEIVRGIALEQRRPGGDARLSGTARRAYTLRQIERPGGVVIGQGQGVHAILLRGVIDAHHGHGALVIRYLANGLFMIYHECRVGLRRQHRRWQLVNSYTGRRIRAIRVRTWMLGITTLANLCPAGPTRTGGAPPAARRSTG